MSSQKQTEGQTGSRNSSITLKVCPYGLMSSRQTPCLECSTNSPKQCHHLGTKCLNPGTCGRHFAFRPWPHVTGVGWSKGLSVSCWERGGNSIRADVGRSLGQTERAELGFWSPFCALQPHPLCSLITPSSFPTHLMFFTSLSFCTFQLCFPVLLSVWNSFPLLSVSNSFPLLAGVKSSPRNWARMLAPSSWLRHTLTSCLSSPSCR